VKIDNFRARPGHSKAFEPKFLGPYVITHTQNEYNYVLEANGKKKQLVHYNRLSHYHVRDLQFCSYPEDTSTNTPIIAKPTLYEKSAPNLASYGYASYYNACSVAKARLRRMQNTDRDARAARRAAQDADRHTPNNAITDDDTTQQGQPIDININEPTQQRHTTPVNQDLANSNATQTVNNTVSPVAANDIVIKDSNILFIANQHDIPESSDTDHEHEDESFADALDQTLRQPISNITSATNAPSTSHQAVYNDKGKEMIMCTLCLDRPAWFEKKYGMNVHIRKMHSTAAPSQNAVGGGGVVTD
jgi:hypothetical protein